MIKRTRIPARSLLLLAFGLVPAAPASAQLSVDIINGYNLIQDSNVTAPSTYAPNSAYIGARICNTSGVALNNVFANVGDYNSVTPAQSTPGVFPSKTFSNPALQTQLYNTGSYALKLEAGTAGIADGTRYIGTLAAAGQPGDCRVQYWLFSYPQCVNVGGAPQAPPCTAAITGGIQPENDPSLDYDVWATSGATTAVKTRSFTVRNEISAAANKIWPNTTSKVPDEYLAALESILGWGTLGPDGQPLTNSNAVYPGQRVITTQGIWYDMGNVGQGFDNDGDLVPDQNAWMQPVGNPAAFDARCFRLVNTYGIVIVKLKTGGEQLIPFQNQLYFEHLADNTGAVGLVYYQFVATDVGCTAAMTPYQEAASGFDNEKFNGDYGLTQTLTSGTYTNLLFTKSHSPVPNSVAANTLIPYNIALTNNIDLDPNNPTFKGVPLGAPDLGTPLVFRDHVPTSTIYQAGSAASRLVPPVALSTGTYSQDYTGIDGGVDTCLLSFRVDSSSFVPMYSKDQGATFSLTEPVPASTVTDLEWILATTISLDGGFDGYNCFGQDLNFNNGTIQTSLPPGMTASVGFDVRAKGPIICNTATLGYSTSSAGHTQAPDTCILVTGDNTLSGTVFRDNGAGAFFGNSTQNAGETGIGPASGAGVKLTLYFDANGNGKLDSTDILFDSPSSSPAYPLGVTNTDSAGAYSYQHLPDGPFLVVLSKFNSPGLNDDATDSSYSTNGWGSTTRDPGLPLTTDTGKVKLTDDLNTMTLAVNLDLDGSTLPPTGVTVSDANFSFAPPLQLTKTVVNNPDVAIPVDVADTPYDEGDLFTYSILLENRLPSNVGHQGPSGCEFTVWGTTGQTGASGKDFSTPTNAFDAVNPNQTTATALIDGGAHRWLFGSTFDITQQPGNITKVEALYFGYFSVPLTDDFLHIDIGRGAVGVGTDGIHGSANTSHAIISTALIDSYIGAPADLEANSAISVDITSMRPGGGTWAWSEFPTATLQINPDKIANADAKTFFLDAVGLRVTTDLACVASPSTTLDPVPLQDDFDQNRVTFVSASITPDSVNTVTGLLQWSNVGPIPPHSSKIVTVTVRANAVVGGPFTADNIAQTNFTVGTGNAKYADGRLANDATDHMGVSIVGKGKLRGTVYNDPPASSFPHGTEPGLPNVSITLWACMKANGTLETGTSNTQDCLAATNNNAWVSLATTTTDANGDYAFLGLDTGYYLVEVGNTDGSPAGGNAPPFGKTQTSEANDVQNATALPTPANPPNSFDAQGHPCPTCNNIWGTSTANLRSDETTINRLCGTGVTPTCTAQETINHVDFGYFTANPMIYGQVFWDHDGGADRDVGDDGLRGFTVELHQNAGGGAPGALVTSTNSDTSGNYSFTGLPACNGVGGCLDKSYVIVVIPPTLTAAVWSETVELGPGLGNGHLITNPAELNNRTHTIALPDGTTSGSYDFGYTKRVASAIGDTVFLDSNGNGYQDAGETGIPNITVWLYLDVDRDGTIDPATDLLVGTDVTDGTGNYLFGPNEAAPAHVDISGGSYIVKVDTSDPDFPPALTASGESDVVTARIGGHIFADPNRNGVHDSGEDVTGTTGGGLLGVLLRLHTGSVSGPIVAATTTNANGDYLFTGLHQGNYFLDVDTTTLPSGFTLTPGSTNPSATVINLASNSDSKTRNAGYALGAGTPATAWAMGNRVWSDTDGDNVQDPGEPGLAGVSIRVFTASAGVCNGTALAGGCVVTSDAQGRWLVSGLIAPNSYTAAVITTTLPRGYVTTQTNSRTFNPATAIDQMTADFGYRYDCEPGGGSGCSPDGTLDHDTGDPTGSISGTVFLDKDGDAAYDPPGCTLPCAFDDPLVGITVNLLDGDNNIIATTTTSATGTYSFGTTAGGGILIGPYTVQSVGPLGTRYSVLFVGAASAFTNLNVFYDSTVESVPGNQSSVNVDGVYPDLNQDFGFAPNLGSIGDTIFWDANQSGSQDSGEPGIAGVTVQLCIQERTWTDTGIIGYEDSGEVTYADVSCRTVNTSADDPLTAADEGGKYLFTALTALTTTVNSNITITRHYHVTVTPPSGGTLTADPDRDGDPCPLTGIIPPACDSQQVVPNFQSSVMDYMGADFGYYFASRATLGDHLWIDANGNGIQESGEQGIPYVTVWLDNGPGILANNGVLDWTDGNGNGVWDSGEGERWVQTDPDGFYLFTDLTNGTYNVRVMTSDPDWPAGLPTAPKFQVRCPTASGSLPCTGDTTAGVPNQNLAIVTVTTNVSGVTSVSSIDDGVAVSPDACSNCNLNADFGYRFGGTSVLKGTICVDDATANGFCGATATTHNGVGAGESPLAGIQVSLYAWTDAPATGLVGQPWTAGGVVDAADTFILLGNTTTDANGDYSFSNVPTKVVVVYGISDTQGLNMTTTQPGSVDGGASSIALYEGTTTYQGQQVTVIGRQALNNVTNPTEDVDFALRSAFGYDFGDLPDNGNTPDYDATLLTSSGAQHRCSSAVACTGIRLGSANTIDPDGYNSPTAGVTIPSGASDGTGDAGDDGVSNFPSTIAQGDNGGQVSVNVQGIPDGGTGWLAGWIDFNGDGDFADEGEQVINQQITRPIGGGAQTVFFDAFTNTTAGPVTFFARFRIYPSQPVLVAATGMALDSSFNPTGGEVEDYRFTAAVTRVMVTSFVAREVGGAVALDWATSSELGTVGYFIQRLDPELKAYVNVNSKLLPSLVFAKQGGMYRFIDPGAVRGETYQYQLVEVEASGRHNVHGPYSVNTSATTNATKAAARREKLLPPLDASGYARVAKKLKRAVREPRSKLAPSSQSVQAVKVGVGATGIYAVNLLDLQAQGLPLTGAYKVTNKGVDVPYTLSADQGSIRFYGLASDSIFTRDNTYWISAEPGPTMPVTVVPSGRPSTLGRTTFTQAQHYEQNLLPATGIYHDPQADYWVWDYTFGGDPAKTYAFRSDGRAGVGNARLNIILKGGTDTEANPDHHAVIRINGSKVGELSWNGTDRAAQEFEFPASLLVDGENQLEIEGLLDTGAPYSIFFLDSFDLQYPRYYRAYDSRLTMTVRQDVGFVASGFSNADLVVFDVTDPLSPQALVPDVSNQLDGTYGFNFNPPTSAVYAAATTDRLLSPTSLVGDIPSELRSPANQGDYLVVTTADMLATAAGLTSLHTDLTPKLVDVVDIYDEFNFGNPSPLAIRDFLAYANSNWNTPPRYVVLAGDGSYDYKDALGAGDNLIPTMMVDTPGYGLFGTDIWLANVQNGPAPDLAIGRLPATNSTQLQAMIDKIALRSSAAEASEPWLGRTLLVSDNNDAAGDFQTSSASLGNLYPGAEHIDIAVLGAAEARTRLLDGINTGSGRINYFGHGGYDILADEGLLLSSDVANLTNLNQPTVITAITCLVGDFSTPGFPSLGELLVTKPQGGAVALWAPSGLSGNTLGTLLAEQYHGSIAGGTGSRMRIGDAILVAMRAYEATGQPAYQIDLYNLLGDPAMKAD